MRASQDNIFQLRLALQQFKAVTFKDLHDWYSVPFFINTPQSVLMLMSGFTENIKS